MSGPACADTTASEFRPPAQIRGLGVARTFVVALASPSDAATRLVASFQLPSMPYRHEASTWARPQARAQHVGALTEFAGYSASLRRRR